MEAMRRKNLQSIFGLNAIARFLVLCSLGINFSNALSFSNEKPTQVGVYYFGGWQSGYNYHLKQSYSFLLTPAFQNRMPLCGWFNDQEKVVEQEIEWAVKGGIDFFAFLWYWPDTLGQGETKLNYPLEVFIKTKVRTKNKLNFCIVYTNHGKFDIGTGTAWTHYSGQWLKLMSRRDYQWIKASRDEISKPLLIIWSPQRFHDHWQSTSRGAKGAIGELKERAIKHGLPGINIGGVWEQTGSKDIFKEDGYDIVTGYGFIGAGNAKVGGFGQYESLAIGHIAIWDSMTSLKKPIIPIITSGWYPRPWPEELKGGYYYPDRTPDKFNNFCLLAKNWLNTHENKVVFPKTILIYAWNELGEGGYIVPTVGDSFAFLDVLNNIFKKKTYQSNVKNRKVGIMKRP